ncbi:hypothetical protein ACFLTD_03575 [Elusimicrobiota bacterium]
MNAVKITFAPFVHTKTGLAGLWADFIVLILPYMCVSFIFEPERIYQYSVILIGFILPVLLYDSISVRKMPEKSIIMRNVAAAGYMSVILPVYVSNYEIFFTVSSVAFFERIFKKLSLDTIFPLFLMSWIVLYSICGGLPNSINPYLMWASLPCGIYLFYKKRISLHCIAGAVLAVMFLIIVKKSLDMQYLLQMVLLMLLLVPYPGIVPGRTFKRILYGIILAVLVYYLGFKGFLLSILLSDFLDII